MSGPMNLYFVLVMGHWPNIAKAKESMNLQLGTSFFPQISLIPIGIINQNHKLSIYFTNFSLQLHIKKKK